MDIALDPHMAAIHHLVAVDDSCTRDDIDALVRSRYPYAAWIRHDALSLEDGVTLTGPWPLTNELRNILDLPRWTHSAWLCLAPHERGGALPIAMRGSVPLLDAYPEAIPVDTELETLEFLQALARRLAGALHLAGTAVVIIPDPNSSVDLTLFAGTLATVESVHALINRNDATIDGASRRGFMISMNAIRGRPEAGTITVQGERRSEPPLAISGFDWEGTALTAYEVRWHLPEWFPGPNESLAPAHRMLRAEVIDEVERIIKALQRELAGAILDDDGFVVAL